MSGICGIWTTASGETAQPSIAAMIRALHSRGPDGTNEWSDGPIALGHTLLATTPEAMIEVLPRTDDESGCAITADARLDNREELLATLGIDADQRTVGDGELILCAYLRWGQDCPTKLLGDFAFAVWDPRKDCLFAARDHMGMRQLIYQYEPTCKFVFATETDGVLAGLSGRPGTNQARIADFLEDLEGLDLTSTFYDGVLRLPPAHSLCVSAVGISIQRYWQLEPGPEIQLDSDEAYADAFLTVFTEAVRCRLRSPGPVGAMLSGGLDSNAVAAVAAALLNRNGATPLKTFSAVALEDLSCPETECIKLGTEQAGYHATLVDRSRLDHPDAELVQLIRNGSEPFDGQMTMARMLFLEAHRQGLKVILHGAGADTILTPGHRTAQLLRSGALVAAWREARGREHFWGASRPAWKTLLEGAWGAFTPVVAKKLRRRGMHYLRASRWGHFEDFVSSDIAIKVGLVTRRQIFQNHLGSGASLNAVDRARSIGHPGFAAGRERYDRVASEVAIEARDPFVDIRVIKLCLSLPPSQLQHHGWPKIVLRRAMGGRIPDRIRWRRGKEHLGLSFTQAFLKQWTGWREAVEREWARLSQYVKVISYCYGRDITILDMSARYKVVMLALWLSRSELRGIPKSARSMKDAESREA